MIRFPKERPRLGRVFLELPRGFTVSEYDIHRKVFWQQLPRRNEGKKSTNELYWKQIDTNCHLGYRSKGAGQGGSWIARYKIGRKRGIRSSGGIRQPSAAPKQKRRPRNGSRRKRAALSPAPPSRVHAGNTSKIDASRRGEECARCGDQIEQFGIRTPFGSTKLAALNTTAIEKWQHNLVTPNRGKARQSDANHIKGRIKFRRPESLGECRRGG